MIHLLLDLAGGAVTQSSAQRRATSQHLIIFLLKQTSPNSALILRLRKRTVNAGGLKLQHWRDNVIPRAGAMMSN